MPLRRHIPEMASAQPPQPMERNQTERIEWEDGNGRMNENDWEWSNKWGRMDTTGNESRMTGERLGTGTRGNDERL